MEEIVTKHGYKTMRFPQDWFEANKGRFTKRQFRELKALARARK
jgi:hypothetical protein